MKSKFTNEPFLLVEVEKPDSKQRQDYEKNRTFYQGNTPEGKVHYGRKATIRQTYDQDKYPIGSVWVISDVPTKKILYKGEVLEFIQSTQLHLQLDE